MAKRVGKLARRYARAFLSATEAELGGTGSPTPAQELAEELQRLATLWTEDAQLPLFILSPMFEAEERRNALLEVGRLAGLRDLGLRFLRVLFERDRTAALPEIAVAFAELADEAAGVVKVKVTTARPVGAEEVREVEAMLASSIRGKTVFSWEVDTTILGGIVVQYGGRVIDGSVTGQLERMERWLVGV